ncbi:sensor histidine kinase [Gellertiella hungarica]|uniref:histidine kinase n=1 Tax=Gellertiella hungarica TaxID=1572859 RepID=A0A7W6J962_9HYPH|nr:sensor histidine kinase [Gellertiella hungarica]MBB4066183.1 two-component sensor histidine kinase [Gellertiella hungarica]
MTRALWLQPAPGGTGRNSLLALALSGSASCILMQDEAWNYLLVANLPECWQRDQTEDGVRTDDSLFGAEIAEKLADLKRNLEASGVERSLEVEVDEQVFRFTLTRIADGEGGLFYQTRIEDITDARNSEQMLHSLQREGSHRSKNMLAVIQSIASQTARHSASLQEFLKKFRDRLHCLSQSQDLITGSRWRGAHFFDLVYQQTKHLSPENRRLLEIEGDNVFLTPNASMHLGLAMHELMVNAANHGTVFESRDAPISVTCTRIHESDGEAIRFEWREPFEAEWKRLTTSGYQKHFGSTVLEHVVPASVGGDADYRLTDTEITYILTFPLEQHS